MDIPKFHETFTPILKILKDNSTIPHKELIKKVIEMNYSDLPKELLEQTTKTGDLLIKNRIAWGKSYLKKGGYIFYPERGMVKITDKGLNALNESLELKDIVNESNFNDFYNPEVKKNITNLSYKQIDATPQELIDSGFLEIETQIKSELLEKLKDIDPFVFQKIILILLQKMGYGNYIETSKSHDGGIDGIINEDKLGLEKIYIQAKRYSENKIREKDIRNFIGAMSGDTRKGVFVTTSLFDDLAIKKAKEAHHTIILIDGSKLVELLYQYNVGVQIFETYEIKKIDEDFFDLT
jgi:restriction system protein